MTGFQHRSLALIALLIAVIATGCSTAQESSPAATTPSSSSGTSASTTADTPAAPNPVAVDGDRVFTGSAEIREGFMVPAGETWVFDPNVSTVVEVAANVVVNGTLVMRPAHAGIEHTLRFVDVDNAAFVGGGMDVIDADVGLWVMGDGQLDISGTDKTAWGYEWDETWSGDEVLAAPHMPGDYTTFATVVDASDVPPANALGLSTELLNLSRNVRIEGTEGGLIHVFIHSMQPQTIRFAAVRYVGPFLGDAGDRSRGSDITGRYGIHFHHNKDGSRGSIIEGVVVRDAQNHAFVAHASHGITFSNTIAYNTKKAAYWWDPTTRQNPGNESHDVIYDTVVAALVDAGEGRDGAFQLGEGVGNQVVNSVAVAVQSDGSATTGYLWNGPEDGVWLFEDNVAHNNVGSGILVWVNTATTHTIERFTAFYNSQPGIIHGAYRNSYVYKDVVLLENDLRRETGFAIESHAVGKPAGDGGTELQLWHGVDTGGAVLRTAGHAQDPEAPVRFRNCDFSSVVIGEGPGHPSVYEFVDCGLGPEDLVINFMHPDSIIRFQNGDTAVEMRADLVVVEIEPFA